MTLCKKCGSLRTIILRKKDYYCDQCFMNSTNHKFRACLGKNKVLSVNENVVVCLSGGPASTVLLDLVNYGISLSNTKKLRVLPHYLHLYDENGSDGASTVLEQCKKYNLPVHIIHLSDFMKEDIQIPEPNEIPYKDNQTSHQFRELLSKLSSTGVEDFISKVKRSLYIKYAREINSRVIFTAETTNTIASSLLSNIALGRGSQVQNDVGLIDSRDESIKIIRPMRDISTEELDYYINIKKIQPVYHKYKQMQNLESTIRSFVEDLQENFHSTISTVCKTSDKIGFTDNDRILKCIICQSITDKPSVKMTALEATNFSRTVSYGKSQKVMSTTNLELGDDQNTSMFPHIHTHLCYACSRSYLEMDQDKLPHHIKKLFCS